MNELQEKQVKMHTSFFDKIDFAIENQFYFEAIFLSYAAIEGRLEVLMGLLNCPCNKELDPKEREKINISNRVSCLQKIYSAGLTVTKKSKLDQAYFKELLKWIKTRNMYMHGLYKNAREYTDRQNEAEKMAKSGKENAKLLYNEVKRIRGQIKKPEVAELMKDELMKIKKCTTKSCYLYSKKGE